MARTQSKGRCRLCGAEFSKTGMPKHVEKCLARVGESKAKREKLFHLFVEGGYQPDYWMDLLVPAQARLGDLDDFLRDIWLECCGHMSAFTIEDQRYAGAPMEELDELDFYYRLGGVLRPGMRFKYEYDYGSTTELAFRVISEHEGPKPRQKVQVLARNDPPVIPCGVCGKPAEQVCVECGYEEAGWLCKACAREHSCGEEMFLPVVNSPRTGECGYTGPERVLAGWE